MILDVENILSDDQDLAQTAGTYLSTYSIDLGAAGTAYPGGTVPKDIGKGRPVDVLVQVTEAFTSGGSATVQARLVMADNAALTTNKTVLQETSAIAVATLVAGYQFRLGGSIPPGVSKRYLGVDYVIATATTTAGKVTAALVADKQTA